MTEQYYLASFFSRYWKLWLLGVVIGALVGINVSAHMSPHFDGNVVLTLTQNSSPPTPGFSYDGYYAKQSGVLARINLINWLQSPRSIYDIYTLATLTPPDGSADSIRRLFKINNDTNERITTNVADIVFTTASREESQKLGNALIKYVKDKYPDNTVTVTSLEPLVSIVTPSKSTTIVASILAFGLIAFVISLIAQFFRPTPH